MPQRSPAEIHRGARLLNVPPAPPRESSAEHYRTRDFANRGSHNSFATGSRDSRDGPDAKLKVGELCDLFSEILDKHGVRTAKSLLGEIMNSELTNAEVNWSKIQFNRQLSDFIDNNVSLFVGRYRGIHRVQRGGSQACTGRPEPQAPDRRNVSHAQSAPGSSSLSQNAVFRMFRFARSLSRAAGRCTRPSSTSQSTSPNSTWQTTSPSSTWQSDASPGSSQGEEPSRGDVHSGDETRASTRTFTFGPIVPDAPRTEPEVNGQQPVGARRRDGHSQLSAHVTADRGLRASSQTSFPQACAEPVDSEPDAFRPGKRVPCEGASSSRRGAPSDDKELVSRRASANKRAESPDQARKARERSGGGGSRLGGDVRVEHSGGGRRGDRKEPVLPNIVIVPAGNDE